MSQRPFIIGVAGGTASGKTTVCESIIRLMSHQSVAMITMDRFYKTLTDEQLQSIHQSANQSINQSINKFGDTPINQSINQSPYNFDVPSAFDFDEFYHTINQLINPSTDRSTDQSANQSTNQSIKLPIYDYKTHSRLIDQFDVIDQPNVVIVEGILTLYDSKIRDLFDLKIFVDTDDDVRLARRILRDIEGRGRGVNDVLNQYILTVKPAFQEFCEPTKRYADLIIPRGGENAVAIDLLVQHVKRELHKRGVQEKN